MHITTNLSKGIFHNSAIEHFNVYYQNDNSGKPLDEKRSKKVFNELITPINQEIDTIVILGTGKESDKRCHDYLKFFEDFNCIKERHLHSENGAKIFIIKKGIGINEHSDSFYLYFNLGKNTEILNLEDFVDYNNIDCQIYTYLKPTLEEILREEML